ncbi:heparinase II/III family protein [Rhizobium sp. FKY42]|uniref:heparinase II/III domain-containing protein n=1 Tax=Rhizobium sp. FKY42 TaxID=2562310 RepID=UPI0010C13C27|nr:heparinase II/III family protein [Rhizobium sp. FKY42]
MFSAIGSRLPAYLADFSPHLSSSGIGEIDPEVCKVLEAAGDAALTKPWSELLASHYRDYVSSGNRARFEDRYFCRRLKLNDLVLAEWAAGSGRYIDQIIDGIFLICEESGWQLPAHNAYVRGGVRLPLPRADRPIVDLFAAETAAILCVVRHLLKRQLDAVDPTIGLRIEEEVGRRILTPYLSEHFWWMGNGEERMNNWTAWITQNVLLSAFLLPTDQRIRHSVALKALGSLDAFVKDYADDGACEEGVVYYRHAALCMFGAMQILQQVGDGFIGELWAEPKIRNMAEFISHMHVSENHYINFADSSAVVTPCGAREYLFGKAVGSKALCSFAAADYRRDPDRLMPQEWNLWYRLQAAEAHGEIMRTPPVTVVHEDVFFPGIGLMIARDSSYCLAAKAGSNGESHNHNDVGSFTVYKDGRPLLIDVGVETYTAKTFSPRRYEIWTMQSAFHNLPTFDDVMQQDGEAFAAKQVEAVLGPDQASLTMELAEAYPAEAQLGRFTRRVSLFKGRFIELTDRYECDRTPVMSLMTEQRPLVRLGLVTLPGLATLEISGGEMPTVEEIKIEDARLRKAWPARLYRTLVPVVGTEFTIRIV